MMHRHTSSPLERFRRVRAHHAARRRALVHFSLDDVTHRRRQWTVAILHRRVALHRWIDEGFVDDRIRSESKRTTDFMAIVSLGVVTSGVVWL